MELDRLTIRSLPELVRHGWGDYTRAWRSHAWMAIVVLGVYGAARIGAAFSLATDNVLRGVLFDLGGLILATGLALPWFTLALAAARGERAGFERSWAQSQGSYFAMTLAAIPFWLIVFLGVVFALGVPSLIVLVWFGLFGYVVANERLSALRALRNAYRLVRGNRIAVAAVALILLVVNAVAALPLGSGVPVAIVMAAPLVVVTTGVSMSIGGRLYLALLGAGETQG